MSERPIGGSPIQIVELNEERQFVLKVESLQSIVSTVGDKQLVIISIAGDFRRGKSFLMNFFLRYLYKKSNAKTMDWLQKRGFPFEGFSSRGGSDLNTRGIVMWSEPFIINENGSEYAVLLMDTQGSFDTEHSVAENSKVFALSTLLSSIQIFNISHNLQENNFDNLCAFIEYGKRALKESGEKPFQKLLFLVRDWQYSYEYSYGFEGGNKLLEKVLVLREEQPLELQNVRKLIKSCFEETNCFLLPHPGKTVANSQHFNGLLIDIDPEFIDCLKTLIPKVLNTGNSFKKINGKQITANDFVEYFRTYVELFAGGTLPEPKSILEANAMIQDIIRERERKGSQTFKNILIGGVSAAVAGVVGVGIAALGGAGLMVTGVAGALTGAVTGAIALVSRIIVTKHDSSDTI